MKLITMLLVGLLYIMSNTANAEYKIYTDLSTFEEDKGAICESATDGCNTYGLIDGKVAYGTKMYCENIDIQWSCLKYKENTITTLSLPVTTSVEEELVMCTMEYAPVCGIDGITYGNKCNAVSGAKVDIAYEGACAEESSLSENDENFYNTIVENLDYKYQDVINKSIEKYLEKIENYGDNKKERINNLIIDKIEFKINEILLENPQDTSLPTDVNNVYLSYSLLKFELMKLSF